MSPSDRAICVDPKLVHIVWPEVSHWIKLALERGDLGLFSEVVDDVLAGRSLLWLAWNRPRIVGAAVTQIYRTEKSKVCLIVACGGVGITDWLIGIRQIEEYAKAEGCDVVRILGRKGWLRMLKDYSAPKIVLERRL